MGHHITTLGFLLRGKLAHHCQGQSPLIMLVRFIFDEFYVSEPPITSLSKSVKMSMKQDSRTENKYRSAVYDYTN